MVARERSIWDELEGFAQPQPDVADTVEQPKVSQKFKKGKKPPIPKNWNTIVLKPIYAEVMKDGKKVREIVDTEGWYEYVEDPQGRVKTYIEANLWGDSKRPCYLMAIDENGEYRAYSPPEFIEYLPEKLYRARKGCESYSKFLSWRSSLTEKIKVFLLVGIMAILVFVTFLIVNGK